MPFEPHPTDPNSVIYKVNKYWIPKPWQGLTNLDIHILKMNHDKVKVVYTDHAKDLSVLGQDVNLDGLINAIETILKEKNGG